VKTRCTAKNTTLLYLGRRKELSEHNGLGPVQFDEEALVPGQNTWFLTLPY